MLGGLALFSAAPAVAANPRRQNGPRLNASGEVDEDLADELVLYIDNDQRFSPESPSGRGKAIRDNLLKKFRKGTYDTSRAVDAWMYLVDDAAKAYAKEFQMGSWLHAFTTGTRRLAAFDIEQRVHKSMRLGEYD